MRTMQAFPLSHLTRTVLGLCLGIGLGVLGTVGSACKVQSVFTCSEDANCLMHGEGGVCEANSYCTFPDPACATGKRWHSRAGDLADECFEVETAGTGGSGTEGTGATSDGADDEGTTSASTTPATTADASSGPEPGSTSDPGGSSGGASTGAPAGCNAQYGAAADYMLCEELPESCMFNVTLGMVMSCNDVCTMYGGTCITAHTNDVEICTPVMETTCDDAASNDGLCVCSNG